MHIGVKFCGGCNETFNRVKALNKIEEALPEYSFSYAWEGKEYNSLLIICGCQAACVSHINLNTSGERYIISKLQDVDRIINILKST